MKYSYILFISFILFMICVRIVLKDALLVGLKMKSDHLLPIYYKYWNEENNFKKPIRILWTRWRSGSSFMADLLVRSDKKTFYIYESLHRYRKIIYGINVPVKVMEKMNQILNCDLNNSFFEKHFKKLYVKDQFNSILEYEKTPESKRTDIQFLTSSCQTAGSITIKVSIIFIISPVEIMHILAC